MVASGPPRARFVRGSSSEVQSELKGPMMPTTRGALAYMPALEPRLPDHRKRSRTVDRRQRPPLRDGEPGRGRRGDRLLEQQESLELLAADHRDPRGRYR